MRIVVKIGTSTLAHPGGRLNIRHTEALVKVWSDIKNAGHELIIVSSGATGLGVGNLQFSRPKDMVTKQAASAVGQCELMYFYDKLFTEYNHIVAQLLLTGEDIRSEQRSRNVRNTLSRLLELGALPVINENDAVATDEIGVDNTIEIWAKEKAEQPFMNPEEFSEALQDILGEENLGEEEAETSDKSVE